MINLGLGHGEYNAYIKALHYSHDARLRVTIYDLSEVAQRELTYPVQQVYDGSVSVDPAGTATRLLALDLVDPKRAIVLDPTSPSHAAVFADNLIGVRHEIYVGALGKWISCPIFKGPVTGFKRNGEMVSIEGMGKEVLNLAPSFAWTTKTYRKGVNIVAAAKDILYQSGERRFDFDAYKHTSPTNIGVAKHTERWLIAKSLFRSIHRQLFYDGRGYARGRPYPTKAQFTFYHLDKGPAGRPPCVTSKPQLSYTFDFANTVEILGPPPAARKPRVQYTAVLPRSHPLSPWALGRAGVPRHIVYQEENDKIKRVLGTNGAKEIAQRILDDKARIGLDAQFTSLPMPFLEEGDMVALVDSDGTHTFRLGIFSIPLTSSADMTIGFLQRPRVKVRKR